MATRWLTKFDPPEGGVIFVESIVDKKNGNSFMRIVEDGGPRGYQVNTMEFDKEQTRNVMTMLQELGHVVPMGNVSRLNPSAKEFVPEK